MDNDETNARANFDIRFVSLFPLARSIVAEMTLLLLWLNTLCNCRLCEYFSGTLTQFLPFIFGTYQTGTCSGGDNNEQIASRQQTQ